MRWLGVEPKTVHLYGEGVVGNSSSTLLAHVADNTCLCYRALQGNTTTPAPVLRKSYQKKSLFLRYSTGRDPKLTNAI